MFEIGFKVVTGIDENMVIQIGIDDNGVGTNHFIHFQYAGGGTNWFAVNGSGGGASTSSDTGVAADQNWHRFRAYWDITGSNIYYYIDYVLVATHTTDMPARGMDFWFYWAGLDANNIECHIDFYKFWEDRHY